MNTIAIYIFSLCVVTCFAAAPGKPNSYTTKYDNINLDEILGNSKLVKSYVNCLLTGSGCTPQGKELREILPDALKTQCSKCNEAQRSGAIKVITKLQQNYPAEWKRLSDKWDPTGEYFRKLTAQIQSTPAKKN